MDPDPSVRADASISSLRGDYYFYNRLENDNFVELVRQLYHTVHRINNADELFAAHYDYFITEDLDMVRLYSQLNDTDCRIALLQNPILSNDPKGGYTLINKPLYCRNFYEFLQGETDSQSREETSH